MTVPEDTFPIGYFYIVSKMNGLVLDIRDPENAAVSIVLGWHDICFSHKWCLFLLGSLQDCYGTQEACFSWKR